MSLELECRPAFSSEDRMRRTLSELDGIDLSSVDLTTLRLKIHSLMQCSMTGTTHSEPDSRIFRARAMDHWPTHRDEVGYPPRELARFGRLNWEGFPLFYGSLNETGTLLELGLKAGDTYCSSLWTTRDVCITEYFGFEDKILVTEYGGRRNLRWFYLLQRESEQNKILRKWVASKLVSKILPEERFKYKLTSMLVEPSLQRHCYQVKSVSRTDGIIYPSVQSGLARDNIALKASFVDTHLILQEVRMRRIERIVNGVFHSREYDSSERIDKDGTIVWRGKPTWKILGLRTPPYFLSTRYLGSEIFLGDARRARRAFQSH